MSWDESGLLLFRKNGRAGQIRTDDPLVPNQMRYQLRYSPTYVIATRPP
jgi:hypothetical protein